MATTLRHMRIHEDIWDPFSDATQAQGSDNSQITRELQAWYANLPGAELPRRPADGGRSADPVEVKRRRKLAAKTVASLRELLTSGADEYLAAELR